MQTGCVAVGLVGVAAQQEGLTQLMLEAHMDRTLTEVPKSLGELYQQSRGALQQILYTEGLLLRSGDAASTGGAASARHRPGICQHRAGPLTPEPDPQGSYGGAQAVARGSDAGAGRPSGSDAGDGDVGGEEGALMTVQEVAGGGAGVAACACGRPLLLGTSDGWLRVPTASHSRARRTVSGKNRCGTRSLLIDPVTAEPDMLQGGHTYAYGREPL